MYALVRCADISEVPMRIHVSARIAVILAGITPMSAHAQFADISAATTQISASAQNADNLADA